MSAFPVLSGGSVPLEFFNARQAPVISSVAVSPSTFAVVTLQTQLNPPEGVTYIVTATPTSGSTLTASGPTPVVVLRSLARGMTYTVTARFTSSGGNSLTSEAYKMTVSPASASTTAPTVGTMVVQAGGSSFVSVSAPSSLAVVSYDVSGTSTGYARAAGAGAGPTITVDLAPGGSYLMRAYGVRGTGTKTASSATFTMQARGVENLAVDLSAPAVSPASVSGASATVNVSSAAGETAQSFVVVATPTGTAGTPVTAQGPGPAIQLTGLAASVTYL
ncbi:hypothetical protein H632_c3259p0, partial [Helicosporidium sp. ATCC 50920]